MKLEVFRKNFYLSAVIFVNLVSSFAESEEGEDNNSISTDDEMGDGYGNTSTLEALCSENKGAYVRRPNLGLTCCGNSTLISLPMELMENWIDSTQLSQCSHKISENNNSDMPAAFWEVALCVFKNASVFPEGKVTYDNYLHFVTRDYPDNIKKEIEASVSSCKTEADTGDDISKIQKFFECFHKSEKEVCDKPSGPTEHSTTSTQYNCPGTEGLLDTEKPTYCCKNQSIPYSFIDFYANFPLDDGAREKSGNCSVSFVNRQKELDPKIKFGLEILDNENSNMTEEAQETVFNEAAALVEYCENGCDMLRNPYTDVKDLMKIDYDGVISYWTSFFGAKMKQDLQKILMNRKSTFVFMLDTSNKTISLDELKKEFETADEISKIHFYCKFVFDVVVETERALHEYCIDKEYADKVYVHSE